FSTVTARPVALLHDAYLARLSTSVAAVLAMKYLAAVNASVLAMLGAGRQAREQLPLIKAVLQLAEVRVYHPIEKKRRELCDEIWRRLPLPVFSVAEPAKAVDGSHIVSTTSSSPLPVLEAGWVAPGAHVSLSRPAEAPDELYRRAGLLVSASTEAAVTLSV